MSSNEFVCGGVVAGLLLAMTAPPVNAQAMPTTTTEFYQTGERFAHCSAHFAFAAEVARQNAHPDSAEAFDGMERGWRVAGLFLLVGGLDPSRQIEVQDTFANLQRSKIEQLRAWREVEPDSYSAVMVDEFQAECAPWSGLQQSIIAAMRSGPTG